MELLTSGVGQPLVPGVIRDSRVECGPDENNGTLVFHVRDGKVTEVWQYWADPYAADELFA